MKDYIYHLILETCLLCHPIRWEVYLYPYKRIIPLRRHYVYETTNVRIVSRVFNSFSFFKLYFIMTLYKFLVYLLNQFFFQKWIKYVDNIGNERRCIKKMNARQSKRHAILHCQHRPSYDGLCRNKFCKMCRAISLKG